MNCILLFFGNLLIAYFSYNFSEHKILSPTFLSSAMYTLFSLEYFCFNNIIGADISGKVLKIVLFSELFIIIGEYLANHTTINNNRKQVDNKTAVKNIQSIYVPMTCTVFFAIIGFVTFVLRLIKLLQAYGGGSLATIIIESRYFVARGVFSFGPVLSALYYISFVASNIFILLFVQCIIYEKKIKVELLLPVLSYLLCAMTTTSRTEFIKLACSFLTAVLVSTTIGGNKKIKIYKLAIAGCAFIAFFIWYGYIMRGVSYTSGNGIIKTIVDYSCASLYGLDYYLENPWEQNTKFGMYTLSNIYALFGENLVDEFEPTYYMALGKSNIYTSLNRPIQDYGIMGMLISRALLSFIAVKFQKLMKRTSVGSKRFFLLFIVICYNVYIFLMAPVGDKAANFYLNPKYIAELVIAFILVFELGMNIQYHTKSGIIKIRRRFRLVKK